MSKLPLISGEDAIKTFGRFGFHVDRQRGSHVVLQKDGYPLHLSVPKHGEIKKGLLRNLIRDAGLTVDQFCKQL